MLVLLVWVVVALKWRKFRRNATPEEQQAALSAQMSQPPPDIPALPY
ncbi:hypothetical protein LP420_31350 [Massilia sp. B-10]|nr:hypothetical protein LP420_31350 [Massilia sp. B-10]